jgi:hypothetical protein
MLLFAPLSDLDLDATVLKPHTIRVDWLYRWSPENLSGRDVKLTPVTLTGHSLFRQSTLRQ